MYVKISYIPEQFVPLVESFRNKEIKQKLLKQRNITQQTMATEFSASTTQDLHDQQRTEQISNLNRLLDKYIGLAANTILPNPTDNRTISQPYSQGPVTSNSADTQAQEFDRITESFPQGLESPSKFQTQPRYGDANTITSEGYQVQAEGKNLDHLSECASNHK